MCWFWTWNPVSVSATGRWQKLSDFDGFLFRDGSPAKSVVDFHESQTLFNLNGSNEALMRTSNGKQRVVLWNDRQTVRKLESQNTVWCIFFSKRMLNIWNTFQYRIYLTINSKIACCALETDQNVDFHPVLVTLYWLSFSPGLQLCETYRKTAPIPVVIFDSVP